MEQKFYPPAFCPEHGIFPATAFEIGPGARHISFVQCVTSCPKCGRDSEVISGVYDATMHGLDILVDKSISLEALTALRQLVEKLKQNAISLEQAQAEAKRISPKAARLFDVANWSDQAKATLYGSIIGAVAVVMAARFALPPTPSVTIQPVIERVVERRSDLVSSTSLRKPRVPLPRPKPRPKEPR